MSTPLLKYINEKHDEQGNKLYWGRALEDGFPFRGEAPPLIADEAQYEQRARATADFKNGTFDTSVPEENQKYCEVMDRISNYWYRLGYRKFFHDPRNPKKTCVYVEWAEFYMEDGTTPTKDPDTTPDGALTNGQ